MNIVIQSRILIGALQLMADISSMLLQIARIILVCGLLIAESYHCVVSKARGQPRDLGSLLDCKSQETREKFLECNDKMERNSK